MPDTLGSLVAFLFFVTPGLAFELLRERARPERRYSAFRETAVIAITSVVLSGAAVLVLALAAAQWPAWFPVPGKFIRDPTHYTADNVGLVTRTIVVEVALATLFGYLIHRLLLDRTAAGNFSANSALWEVVRGRLNPEGHRALLAVELEGGSTVTGLLKGYDLDRDTGLRTIVLHQTDSHRIKVQPAHGAVIDYPEGWAYCIVPADRIKGTAVAYVRRPPGRAAAGGLRDRTRRRLCAWLGCAAPASHESR